MIGREGRVPKEKFVGFLEVLRDLAKDMGRGLASFYNYFSSKEDVLFALQQGAFEALIARAETMKRGAPLPSGSTPPIGTPWS